MSDIMAVLLNGVAQLEYHRDKPLPAHQELYLEKMDHKMDQGIMLGDTLVAKPDLNQRAQFVAGNLAHAILSNDEAMSSALCSYLATRLPELKQVKIQDQQGEISIDLVFDEEYQKQVAVQFFH
jgi:hypothetical protein